MQLSDEKRNKIGKILTLRIAQALDDGDLDPDEQPFLARAILENIDVIQTHEHLLIFLEELNRDWSFFSNIYESEKVHSVHTDTTDQVKKAEELIKSNKVDEAIEHMDQDSSNNSTIQS